MYLPQIEPYFYVFFPLKEKKSLAQLAYLSYSVKEDSVYISGNKKLTIDMNSFLLILALENALKLVSLSGRITHSPKLMRKHNW